VCVCVCVCVLLCGYTCDFFPLQSHEVQGRCAQVHRISYTILQNVATVHLTWSRRENVELSVSSDSMRSFKYVPGFFKIAIQRGIETGRISTILDVTWIMRKKPMPCLLNIRFSSIDSRDLNYLYRNYIGFNRYTYNWNCSSVRDTSI